ncbi:hypothetical protein LOTGIDRAFT_170979 [Lottia gigantea]|uniref:Polypeptide N-acetylgalactosaminyltransferase n=1 Tax=Lottia gigantea TaxID=225164 RepID=V4AJC1_LOTGI|nr:hypothetical protein LOTGIDRAFT_170979 [Lottia gigantea]ESP04279.1 hypothetical protein LOTGIDRAFT_170979 [Lottia gigantea]
MLQRRFMLKFGVTVICVWTMLAMKLTFDTSVPSFQDPMAGILLKKKQLRENVGYFVGKRREIFWPFLKLQPNYTEVKEVYGVDLNTIGENGKGLSIDTRRLSKKEQKKVDTGYVRYAIKEYVGNLVSVRRNLPDPRIQDCKDISYPKDLPKTSIIMCFHDEAWTSLLRSVHSIIDRTPPRLVEEIILVDDNSTYGWLEPLLEPIMKNPRTVTMPTINTIDSKTFAVNTDRLEQVGIFTFPILRFSWMKTPERIDRDRSSPADYIQSPTMAGGLFSISKVFFNHIGTYDNQLDIWGGENIEISVKIWMCGGSILISPCSHVAHIFKARLPYVGGYHVMLRNLGRVANVWFDDYKYKFINQKGNIDPFGDISERVKLREKLQCNDFEWYRRNIFPEMYFPGSGVHYGNIQSVADPNLCIDGAKLKRSEPIIPYPCHSNESQQWDYTEAMQIRIKDLCLDFSGATFRAEGCGPHDAQNWKYQDKKIINRVTGQCIGLSKDGSKLQIQKCDYRLFQLWNWKKVREPFIPDFYKYL